MVHVYLLKNKLYLLETFQDFKSKVGNKLNTQIKKLRTDNGKKHRNCNLETFLSQHGIVHQISTLYSPEHTGFAKRMNSSSTSRTSRAGKVYAALC